ncbi:MAG: Cell division FtsK/SpoIIIE [Candidatus Jorgensenbacteria bacterium GW2011_GWA1_48_13]|uniref:Cell division FtsK/SpoIIIE n=2 Tax=Candidatus Joergenseniibacteriota TaxID=1752739 RepID=A0A0G1W906_9BACT|nr:MAG: Cell division FtsK/SpoIIIE [Candidatus Jorgensenbacteria bacterium GW2011_GWA1_48_13]KKU99386.1 MAG: cell division FtsK/SpoIIIE [Candidatus Jorgensenbacteria bacterium GW2011_GWC1_48_8]KKW15271.1 MAG: Cell division FtsK/SpoIIIE [Candidatus Jorgensenbacteria bacterium GW2011_GWB1_50_10]
MARKKKKERQGEERETEREEIQLHPDVKKSVWLVAFLGVAVLFILAGTGQAGPLGGGFYSFFDKVLGWGYYLLPLVFLMLAFSFIQSERRRIFGLTIIAGLLFVASGLGFIDIVSPGAGGLAGELVGALQNPFGTTASLVITLTVLLVSFLVVLNKPIKFRQREKQIVEGGDEAFVAPPEEPMKGEIDEVEKEPRYDEVLKTVIKMESGGKSLPKILARRALIKNYVPPPLSLLSSTLEKPTIGDLRANANIIKRTLDGFGIPVEMGEINVGPTVTRYTLKPAEGVKLSRLTALHQDLALTLAAHPVRIEAPIPGKSLVGIEVPNKAAALVRLGSLILYPDFQKSAPLTFILGRNVSGEPIFVDIDKMPHLLVAGATGSGKSILIHSLIISLLYKNSPEMLKLIMIDPKRVELSVYDGIPHLLSPVITDNKKALGVLRWVVSEMDRRYELLLQAGARDIKSYNSGSEKLPYLLIVIDELADLMASFGREVEGSIIRLAQMSRATGLHLVVSTQRPSVEVITGLIKANITSRVALQVASQVDSRTILDNAGAEKLLGSGDLLFVSAELSKPRRIQGAYVSEEEVKKVASFIKENNKAEVEEDSPSFEMGNGGVNGIMPDFEDYESGDDDELYSEAVELVRSAKKASASLLQRRLRVGYARAARLLDIMEERGVVGPGEGARPREVF